MIVSSNNPPIPRFPHFRIFLIWTLLSKTELGLSESFILFRVEATNQEHGQQRSLFATSWAQLQQSLERFSVQCCWTTQDFEEHTLKQTSSCVPNVLHSSKQQIPPRLCHDILSLTTELFGINSYDACSDDRTVDMRCYESDERSSSGLRTWLARPLRMWPESHIEHQTPVLHRSSGILQILYNISFNEVGFFSKRKELFCRLWADFWPLLDGSRNLTAHLMVSAFGFREHILHTKEQSGENVSKWIDTAYCSISRWAFMSVPHPFTSNNLRI